MLGKRSHACIHYDIDTREWGSTGGFSFENIKKQRISTQEELDQLEPVADRVLHWFLNNQPNLPKTLEKLTNLMSHLCKISVTVDPQIVYYHLLLNGVVVEVTPEKVLVNTNFDRPELRGFILDHSGLSPTLSSDFCSTLTRTVSWCLTNRSPPKTRLGFLKALKQLCTFRREVPSTAILRILTNREYLSISSDGRVDYPVLHLPSLAYLTNPTHYMAQEC